MLAGTHSDSLDEFLAYHQCEQVSVSRLSTKMRVLKKRPRTTRTTNGSPQFRNGLAKQWPNGPFHFQEDGRGFITTDHHDQSVENRFNLGTTHVTWSSFCLASCIAELSENVGWFQAVTDPARPTGPRAAVQSDGEAHYKRGQTQDKWTDYKEMSQDKRWEQLKRTASTLSQRTNTLVCEAIVQTRQVDNCDEMTTAFPSAPLFFFCILLFWNLLALFFVNFLVEEIGETPFWKDNCRNETTNEKDDTILKVDGF